MFTGIIDHCGTIVRIESISKGLRLWIKTLFTDFELGESIAINGICLTVTEFHEGIFCCDLSPETLKVTTANSFYIDQMVNLERALLPTSRMGGHFVMGHVDQVATVESIQQLDDFVELKINTLNREAMRYIIKKGSIAIDGVSLTINDITDKGFVVMLIPHTLERTNLKKLQKHTQVNLEFDLLARLLTKHLEKLNHE